MNTKRTEVFFLTFRLNRKLCIFLCTKCTDALDSSFLFTTLDRVYTQADLRKKKKRKNAFVFYRLCAPSNGLLYHMKMLGWEVRRIRRSRVRASLWVSGLCRECVCRLHKICATCNYFIESESKKKNKKNSTVNVSRGNRVPFKKHEWSWRVCKLYPMKCSSKIRH